MGILDLKNEDIYYDKGKHSNLVLSANKVKVVSLYLDKNMERELLNVIGTNSVTRCQFEEKISKINSLKQEVLATLVGVRSEYKKLYYQVKDGKNLSAQEMESLEELRKIKESFVSYVRFLDGTLRIEHKALNTLIRKTNRYNNVDMKTSIILDNDSKFIYDMMVDHENFYEPDNHVYLQALSYYIKNVDFSKLSENDCNTCMGYVDEVLSRFKADASVYLENMEDVNLLKQVVRQRGRSLSKEDKLNRDFLGMVTKRILSLEERHIGYSDTVEEMSDGEMCSAFYRAINYEKNINVISSFLNERPDLIYMESPTNQNQYYLADIISRYGNLLLNSRENHEEFLYYRLLINTYIDTICTLDNQDMKVFVLRKLQRIIKNTINSDFNMRRKEACFFEVEECINRINGKKQDNLLEFHDNKASFHKMNNESIFSIDNDDTKKFEQAYSYREENGNKYLSFYIPDTTELYGSRIPTVKELLANSSEVSNVLNGKMSRLLSLKQGNSHDVIGYHFAIDSDYKVKDLDIRKEKINVSNNFLFSDIDVIVESDNYYSDIILKMIDTLDNIDSQENLDLQENVNSSDNIFQDEEVGANLTARLSLFFQKALGKYCDDRDIPYISKFVYTKEQKNMGLVKEIDEILNSKNLTVEQIMKSVENAYLAGIYTTNKEENMRGERRAKVTAPFRQLSSFINQIVIYHYFTNGDDISYREDLKNRRDLRNITDCMNKKIIEEKQEEQYREEKELRAKIKSNNRKQEYRIRNVRKASEN